MQYTQLGIGEKEFRDDLEIMEEERGKHEGYGYD